MAAFDRKLVKREETTATGRWNEKGSPGLFSPVYYIIILPCVCPFVRVTSLQIVHDQIFHYHNAFLGCGRWQVLATTLAATAFSHTATTTRFILVNVTLNEYDG